ncbi:hypothetical protein D3C72_334910 [compost metagenome]
MRLDEINNHGDDQFYAAVGAKLAELLGVQLQLADIKTGTGRQSSSFRKVTYKGKAEAGEFLLVIDQHWEMGQSPTKPYTSVDITDEHGLGNGSINFGRYAFWRDDPSAYAEDLANSGDIEEKIHYLLD